MKEQTEDKLLAELYVILKGSKEKPKDWISTAKICKRLIDHYGSKKIAAQKLGVSYELVRSIASLLDLPPEVQNLIREGKILLDAAQRLSRIGSAKEQVRVAELVAGMRSHDARQLIQYAKRFPDADLDEFKKRLTSVQKETKRIDIVILPIQHDLFEKLKQIGTRRGFSVQRVITELLSESVAKIHER